MDTRRGFLRGASLGLMALGSGFGASRAAGAQAEGPTRSDEQVERLLAVVRDGRRLPGLIGAIVLGGRVAAIGARGVRRLGSPEPIRPDDLVHLGSCTKAMTATMIGSLVDEGKLAWTTNLGAAFPDAGAMHPAWRSATLSQLLTHRAGLPHDGPLRHEWGGLSTTEQRLAIAEDVLRDAPRTRPGSTFAYSNLGYALAGLMAERAAGEPWESLMRRRLFEPLDMATAGFGPPGTDGEVDQPWGHRLEGGRAWPTRDDNPDWMGPACLVHCSLPDWAKFAALHLQGARSRGRLPSPATLRALQTPPTGRTYAGGWEVVERSWAGGRALNHLGSNLSWYVSIWLAPALDLAILVATNQGGDAASSACNEATEVLLANLPDAPGRPRPR